MQEAGEKLRLMQDERDGVDQMRRWDEETGERSDEETPLLPRLRKTSNCPQPKDGNL
jgi:hypothetical protein